MKLKTEIFLEKIIEQCDMAKWRKRDVEYILRKKLDELQEERLDQ